MPADFDKCVQKVMATGKSKSSAFAICTMTFKKAGKKTRENMEESFDTNEKEIKYDEDGHIVVAENAKILIDSNISVVEE